MQIQIPSCFAFELLSLIDSFKQAKSSFMHITGRGQRAQRPERYGLKRFGKYQDLISFCVKSSHNGTLLCLGRKL